jgi:hypothetical protein
MEENDGGGSRCEGGQWVVVAIGARGWSPVSLRPSDGGVGSLTLQFEFRQSPVVAGKTWSPPCMTGREMKSRAGSQRSRSETAALRTPG